MEKQSKIGILTYIAKTGAKGVKFKDEPEVWYNPTQAAREQVSEEYINHQVEIMLSPDKKTEFSSMVLLEDGGTVVKILNEETVVEKIGEILKAKDEMKQINNELKAKAEEDESEEVIIEVEDAPVIKKPIVFIEEDMVLKEEEYKSETGVYNTNLTMSDITEMQSMKLSTVKKGSMNLTYASWSEVWGEFKKLYPEAQFKVYENENSMPYFADATGGFVKVGVTIKGLEHINHLPIMDHSNKAMKKEQIDAFAINKSIQRCLVKAVALHGLGLYIYKGEDIPK